MTKKSAMRASGLSISALRDLVAAAAGEQQADTLLTNVNVVNVFSGDIEHTNVAFKGGLIAGVSPHYKNGAEVVDCRNGFLLPGLIDAHTHIESSLLTPYEYAGIVVAHGTAAVMADPHEIANVMGITGVAAMTEAAKGLPLDIRFMAPSCVPSSPFESPLNALGPKEVGQILRMPGVGGLGEVMDFAAVQTGDSSLLRKILATRKQGLPVDGHAPALTGTGLNTYLSVGIRTDHECSTAAEAVEKVKRGVYVLIREGSAAQDMQRLLPAVDSRNAHRFAFCTDDAHCSWLLDNGHMDYLLRQAVQRGLPATLAVAMATLYPAQIYGLDGYGAIAPGYLANAVLVDDLRYFVCRRVWHKGRLVAENGELCANLPTALSALQPFNTIHTSPLKRTDLEAGHRGDTVRVIGVTPGHLTTTEMQATLPPDSGISKIVVVERHHATGDIGIGYVHGLGPLRCALGSSVAHDAHNIIACGASDVDILACITALEVMGGGFVVATLGQVVATLPLPVAGLMSAQPAEKVAAQLVAVEEAARSLGCTAHTPFAALSFLALPVLPELRLSHKGLVDVRKGTIVPLLST